MKVSLPGARWNYYIHTYWSWRRWEVGLTVCYWGERCIALHLLCLSIEAEW